MLDALVGTIAGAAIGFLWLLGISVVVFSSSSQEINLLWNVAMGA